MDIVSVASVIISAIGAAAAVAAAKYAKDSPTKHDLERVERNTAESSERIDKVSEHIARVDAHLSEQRMQDSLVTAAERISIKVSGQAPTAEALPLLFSF